MMRTIVILVDGMRPDALKGIPQAERLIERATYTMSAKTVMPSVTLPCHMSLFHSVDPTRHGTTTNTYTPQVRPIRGLCEVLAAQGKKNAFFYNWEELRDLSRPGSLAFSYFCSGPAVGYEKANEAVADAAIEYLRRENVDFAFVYLGHTDEAGHQYGWMSDPYLAAMRSSWELIERIVDSLDEEDHVIITADHGGHDRIHGTDLPEDMTIPLLLIGRRFEAGKELALADIKDIAPTVAALLGVQADSQWEGTSLL